MSLRVAIAGVGNCANSLVQGVSSTRTRTPMSRPRADACPLRRVPRPATSSSWPRSTSTPSRSGVDLAEAIWASENNTLKFADVAATGVTVQRGPTLDGLGEYYRATITSRMPRRSTPRRCCGTPGPTCWSATCRSAPTRPRSTTRRRRWMPASRSSTPAGVHRERPGVGGEVRRGRRPDRRRRHQEPARRHHHPPGARAPVRVAASCWTAPISSTSAATWTSRTCSSGAPGVEEDLQDPGGHEQHRRDARPAQRVHRPERPHPVAR